MNNANSEEDLEPFSGNLNTSDNLGTKKKHTFIAIVIISIVLVIAGIGTLIYFLFQSQSTGDSQNDKHSIVKLYTIKEKLNIFTIEREVRLFKNLYSEIFDSIVSITINNSLLNLSEISVDYFVNYQFDTKGICEVEITFNKSLESMEEMFSLMVELIELDLTNIDTSNVKSMRKCFDYSSELKNINISNFNTSLVTDMSYMFNGCNSLSFLNLSNFNTSLVTDMSYMFAQSGLITIDIKNFNTSNVIKMQYMFYSSRIIKLDLYNFNTSNVYTMKCMFYYAGALTSLDLSSFDVKNVYDFSYMFHGCRSLSYIDISNFNTKSMSYCNYMFASVSSVGNITYNPNIVSSTMVNQFPDNWGLIKVYD